MWPSSPRLPEPGGGGRMPCGGESSATVVSREPDFRVRNFPAARGFRRAFGFFGDADFVRREVLRKISVLL